jgi:signal transduction histidine kinase
MNFILQDNSFEQLNTPERLASILKNLKKCFGGFTDLGVIDSMGIQCNYVGPYKLKDKNYREQRWYKQVIRMGVHISDVFLGYRNVPHMVIAVKRDLEDGSFFILRAALDIVPLKNMLSTLEIGGSGDAFLVNHGGIIQIPSRGYAEILENISMLIPGFSEKTEALEKKMPNGKTLLIGYRYIEDSPFILMIIKDKDVLMKPWYETRVKLIAFLAASIILILAVIFANVTYIVNKLYMADERRVTALNQAEHANKMASVGRLASGVAHEINNPLAIINEKAGLIQDLFTFKKNYAHDDKLMGLVNDVLLSVKRCARITKRLLRFARHMDVSIESTNLEELLSEVLGFLEKEAEYRSIAISLAVNDVPVFTTDRGKLQQVFLNLINNAFVAMDDGGHLDIMAECKKKGFVSVIIADDGCGIPEENLKQIFEPFFSTKTGQGGTGLGLSITYGLVRELGGMINVGSQEGKGSIFTVTLPLQMEGKDGLKK